MSPFPRFFSLEEGGCLLLALFLLQDLCCNALMLLVSRKHGSCHPQQMVLGATGLRSHGALKWKNILLVFPFLQYFSPSFKTNSSGSFCPMQQLPGECNLICYPKVLRLLLGMQVIWYSVGASPNLAGWSLADCPAAVYQLCSLLQSDKSKQLGRSSDAMPQEHCLLKKEQLLSAVLVTTFCTLHVLGYLERHRLCRRSSEGLCWKSKNCNALRHCRWPVSSFLQNSTDTFCIPSAIRPDFRAQYENALCWDCSKL